MRKGIKKWHSKNAKIAQLKKDLNKNVHKRLYLEEKQSVLEGFIVDIYNFTKRDQKLVVENKDVHHLIFMRENGIADIGIFHDQRPIVIKKPIEVAQEYQFEQRAKDIDRMFDCNFY